jgi:hypothetical protein
LTPGCAKSISVSLLYLVDELWNLDHSIIPPGLVIISANILCASLKVFAEVVKMASSTYASIDSQVCWEFLECQHCNIDKVPWRVAPSNSIIEFHYLA